MGGYDFGERSPVGEYHGLAFGPDNSLYVAHDQSNSVQRYNSATGRLIDVFVSPETIESGPPATPAIPAVAPKPEKTGNNNSAAGEPGVSARGS